jgi:hypothetical protein
MCEINRQVMRMVYEWQCLVVIVVVTVSTSVAFRHPSIHRMTKEIHIMVSIHHIAHTLHIMREMSSLSSLFYLDHTTTVEL